MYTKYELDRKCKHILDYGKNWGFIHVKGEIQWRLSAIKHQEQETKELKVELQAFQKLLSKMEEQRILSKMVVKRKK